MCKKATTFAIFLIGNKLLEFLYNCEFPEVQIIDLIIHFFVDSDAIVCVLHKLP